MVATYFTFPAWKKDNFSHNSLNFEELRNLIFTPLHKWIMYRKMKVYLYSLFSKGMFVYLDLLLCTTLQKSLCAACRKWDFAKTQNNGHFLPTRHCAEKICIFSRIFTPSAQIKKRGLFGCKQSLFLSTDARVYRSLNSLLFLSTTKKTLFQLLGHIKWFFVREILWSTFNVGKIVTTHGLLY